MAKHILRDVPVEKKIDEKLGLENYAQALSEFIYYCDTPVTIGIQGDWGIGKTSLLNMIVENLRERKPSFYTIKIETWRYALFTQEEYIAFSVINAINQELLKHLKQEKIDIGEKKDFFKKFAKFGYSVIDQIISNNTGASMKQAASDSKETTIFDFEDIADAINKYKQEFINLVNLLIPTIENVDAKRKVQERNLVIILDDLDRIKPIRALELLEAIKNFLDIPKCVFILAIDYSVIEQGMEQKLGKSSKDFYGKSFFDKIIQIPFNMPVASYKTDRFIMSILGLEYVDTEKKYFRNDIEDNAAFLNGLSYSSISNLNDNQNKKGLLQDEADYFANVTQLTTKNNPRSIKRLVNYSNLLKLICTSNRKKEQGAKAWTLLDAKIIFSIAALQLAWPEIFNYFAANPSPGVFQQLEDGNYIAEIAEAKPLFDRVKDPLETQSKISAFFDQFLMLIDNQDGDGKNNGEISTTEFRPVWQVLKDTNLTNAKLEDIPEQWKEFSSMVTINLERTKLKNWIKQDNEEKRTIATNRRVSFLLYAFQHGKWNNQLYFRLLEGAKSFRNMYWGKKHIGSLVSTQGEILTLYINEKCFANKNRKDFFEYYKSQLNEEFHKYLTPCNTSHYGVGQIKVDLFAISNETEQIKVMDILDSILVSIINLI